MSDAKKAAAAMELGSDVLVGILKRRAAAKKMDMGTLLAEASLNSQEADRILDRLASEGMETEGEGE